MSIKTVIFFLFTILSSTGVRIFSFACAFYILRFTDVPTTFTLYLTAIVASSILLPILLGRYANDYNNKIMGLILHLLNVIVLFIFTVTFDTYFNYILFAGIMLNVIGQAMRHFTTTNLPYIIPTDEQAHVIAWRHKYEMALHILAPVVSGACIGFINIEHFALFNILTEAGALCCLLMLPIKKGVPFIRMRVADAFQESFHFLAEQKQVSRLLFTAFVVDFLIAAFAIILPIAAIQVMDFRAYQLGIVEAGYTIGLMLFAYFYPFYRMKATLKKIYQISILLQCFALFALGVILAFEFYLMLVIVWFFVLNVVIGVSHALAHEPVRDYLQKVADARYKSHLLTFHEMVSQALTPLSLLCFGLLLNYGQVIVCFGVSFLIVLIFFYFKKFFNSDFQID